MGDLSRRQEVMLAALAARPHAGFAPVQVQKLFFLLDQKIPDEFSGKLFNFEPYDYGPFDRSVYAELDALAAKGFVAVVSTGDASKRLYGLTPKGFEVGHQLYTQRSARAQAYMAQLSDWIRSLTFRDLVSAIYKEFPAMRARSVFKY